MFCLLEKLFGKRLVQARHYIMSRKSWLKMVPTENCDILMTFPGTISSSVLWWVPPSSRVLGGPPATQDLTYPPCMATFHPFMLWKLPSLEKIYFIPSNLRFDSDERHGTYDNVCTLSYVACKHELWVNFILLARQKLSVIHMTQGSYRSDII